MGSTSFTPLSSGTLCEAVIITPMVFPWNFWDRSAARSPTRYMTGSRRFLVTSPSALGCVGSWVKEAAYAFMRNYIERRSVTFFWQQTAWLGLGLALPHSPQRFRTRTAGPQASGASGKLRRWDS